MALRDDRLLSVLQKVAPGTALREGIDRIIRAGKGAIIVLGDSPEVEAIVSGGFKMATKFTAQRLSEVAKMDGAIVLDDALERILYANVHLVPDPTVPTSETGTRHRSAERCAKQTGKPVISVSESMRTVSLYIDSQRHRLEEISSILFRANQAISTLERYRVRFDEVSRQLEALELQNMVTLRDVTLLFQRALMMRTIAREIDAYVAELGVDGRLLRLQLDELLVGLDREFTLLVRDYMPDRRRKVDSIAEDLDAVADEDLINLDRIADALGYDPADHSADQPVTPRGYRVLSRIPRLPEGVVSKLVARFGSLHRLLEASLADLDDVEGVGEARARSIHDGLRRLVEHPVHERYG